MAREKQSAEPSIAEGVGSVFKSKMPRLSGLVEEAMGRAIMKCYAAGVTDPEKIKEAKFAASAEVKEKYYAAVAAESKAAS